MAYRSDKDLAFLGEMKSADLNNLVDVIIKDKDGSTRFTEELTNKDIYKKYYPDHSKYWKDIAAEIQCFGANTIITVFRRGEGVLYREILIDVCKKLKVNYKEDQSIASLEDQLLIKLLGDATANMTEAARAEFSKITGINAAKMMTPEGLTAAAQVIFAAGGFKSYQITLMVVNAISKALLGRGLAFAGNAALARTLGVLSGPIGWTLTGVWTAFDIASPAFRVTLPAVLHVALLRKQYQAEKDKLFSDIETAMNADDEAMDAVINPIIECENCAQKLRIPTQGSFQVTCPSCRHQWFVNLS
ncbi:DUF3944 domain-containing protein [Comamonas nitrativorans]|uniref:DUF3944 domain-containing protein n=1 Tax=Comamonas nitrativorans TaxID=108437 RepID=A0ABV9GWH8_9BURK